MVRLALAATPALHVAAAPASKWRLLSHRGVFTPSIAENSAAAIEEAIRRGYWMVEIDLRRSADGRIVIQHDANFERVFGVNRKVSELTWPEIRKLRSNPGNEPPLEFADVAKLAKGRIGLWLDIKEKAADNAFLAQVEQTLRQNGLIGQTIVGINPKATPYFAGRIVTAEAIQKLYYEAARPNLSRDWVMVEGLGFTLSDEAVQWGLQHHLTVIPFVGISQYPGTDAIAPGTAVIKRLQAAGVTNFMIDSVFEPLFRK